jgi:hypothetical protein
VPIIVDTHAILICPNCNTRLSPLTLTDRTRYLRCTKCDIVETLEWWSDFEGLDGIINARYWKHFHGIRVELIPNKLKIFRLFEY